MAADSSSETRSTVTGRGKVSLLFQLRKTLYGLHGERNARFHIEHAGAEEQAIFNFARHIGKRAQRINGIKMAEQKNGIAAAADEVNLQMIAKI